MQVLQVVLCLQEHKNVSRRNKMKELTEISSEKEAKDSVVTYTVDSFANGIAFGRHKLGTGDDPRDCYNLRLEENDSLVHLRSRYLLHEKNPLAELENHLMRLSRDGILGSAIIHFGCTSDPFFPFDGKFDASMKFLELFQRYTPGMLIVQTRSPLLVIAMPVLKRLGKHVSVTLGLETCLDESVSRYTPGYPKVQERLKAAAALRNFGVKVNIQVNPVLPYGDWRKDASSFADVLVRHADHIHVKSVTDGSTITENRIRTTPLARKLAEDRRFHWLRPDSANPLITAIEKIAPEKLEIPEWKHLRQKQLSLFAA